MTRHIVLLLAALALAAPAPASAQSSVDREREREQERVERIREAERDARERAREQAQERAERAREQAEERAERDRERNEERAERDRENAGALDTTVTFDARGTVSVSCPGGDVVVTGSDRNQIVVRARSERGAIRFVSTGTNATLEPAASRGCSDAHFELSVPAGVHLVANTWSGSLTVKGVKGEIDAHAQSGDVDVRDAGDDIEVETLSGNVTIEGARGAVNVHTVSGDISLTGGRGSVEIETVSGDMELRDVVSNQVRTNSTSGDLTFAGAILDAGRYQFETHSGELRLELPANVGAQLSLSTFSGEIDSAFPITLTPGAHGIGASQAKKLTFSLGQGSARILAETFSGDVTLTSTGRRP